MGRRSKGLWLPCSLRDFDRVAPAVSPVASSVSVESLRK